MNALPDTRAGSGDRPPHSGAEHDLALLERAVGGDERALGAIYDRHGATVYALAKAIVKSNADAEDVVAAVFAQLWRSAAQYDPARGALGAWLCTITRTRALDLLRSRKRREHAMEAASRADDDGLALPLSSSGPAPDAGPEIEESRALITRSLQALPEAQRRVIEMAYFGGLSQSEIAAELSEPLGTVKTRMRAGMEKLRQALGPMLRETSP